MSQDAYRLFNLDEVAAKLNRFTVNVHDYKMVSKNIARVILSYTGQVPTQDAIREQISAMLDGNAAAVAGSFRELTRSGDVKSMIGFVKASREVLPFDEATSNGSAYKAMASNLLMKKDDETMWEIKSGAMGKYLAKQSSDDLRELINLAHNSCSGLPRFNQIASLASVAEPKEFAAFVDLDAEEVLHGFVIASSADKVTVIAKETNEVVEVAADQLVHIQEVDSSELGEKQIAADMSNPSAVIEYWRSVYRYSPEYIQKIIDMVGMHSYA